ncbi:MAG: AbrB/MazE/SpoVT family DNA-binding domain-containing protein [Candidatus Asgardarchaeia archaeon]
MTIIAKGYVGKKEEIYIEKKARKKIGLKPGDRLVVFVKNNELRIRRIPSLKELLEKETLIEIDDEEIRKISDTITKNIPGRRY